MPRPRTSASLIYWKRGRAYADFRGPEFAPWGGRLTALVPDGGRSATTDPELAAILLARHLERFRTLRDQHPRGLAAAEEEALNRIAPFAGHHIARLRLTRRNGRVAAEETVLAQQSKLIHAARFFAGRKDKERPHGIHYLREITPADVSAWLDHIAAHPPTPLRTRHGGRLASAGGTYVKYLAALRRMLDRAWREDRIPYNPVEKLPKEERPTGGPSPTHHLEVAQAALVLEAARRQVQTPAGRRHYENYVRMATYLLTGGSGNDVEGLEKADIDWRNELVWFRHNPTRRGIMKGRPERTVPLFPQLQEILGEYLAGEHCPPGPALFRGGDMGRWLDGVAQGVGMPRQSLNIRVFRVTYATTRVQTMDGGQPVAETTVLQEMGHRSSKMLREVYARVGRVRHRSEHVEYRWEAHEAEMGHRLNGTGDRLSPQALAALRALGRRRLTWKAWRERAGFGGSTSGTFAYIKDRLVAGGYVLVDGDGRGATYRRTGAGDAAADAARDERAAAGG